MGDAWVDIPLAVAEGRAKSSWRSDAQLTNLQLVPQPPGSPQPFIIESTPCLVDEVPATYVSGVYMRGMIQHGDYVWWVAGEELFTWDGETVVKATGAIDGDGSIVFMTPAGNNLIVISVFTGLTTTKTYFCTIAAATEITQPANGLLSCANIDGRVIWVRTGTNEFYWSDIDDATSIDPLAFSTADAIYDKLEGVIVLQRMVVLLGKVHTEFWYSDGSTAVFARSQPGVEDVGLYAAGSLAQYNNVAYFIGHDRRIYRLQGYQATPISPDWVQSLIPERIFRQNIRGSIHVEGDRPIYQLSFSVFGDTQQPTLCYDIKNNLWHVRLHPEVYGYAGTCNFTVGESELGPVGQGHVLAIANRQDGNPGLYELDPDGFEDETADDAEEVERTLVCPPVDARGNRIFETAVMIDMERIAGGTVRFDYSNAGAAYKSHGANTVDVAQAIASDRESLRWNRCGAYRKRNHKFVIKAPGRVSIAAVRHQVEGGL